MTKQSRGARERKHRHPWSSREQARRHVGELFPMYPPFRAAWQMTTTPCITFPAPSLKFRTAGFPQYGFKAGLSGGAFLHTPSRTVCFRPSCFPWRHSLSVLSRSYPLGDAPPFKRSTIALPQRPSLRHGLCCPAPSSLNRPHPPHLQTHRDFAARRLIPDAFAVPCGPRSTSGSVLSLRVPSRHAILYDPGEFIGDTHPVLHRQHWPSPCGDRLGTLHAPHHPLPVEAKISGLHWFAFATACRVASLLDGSDQVTPAPETFTSGLSTGRSPSPLPDMTTVVSGHSPPVGLSPTGTAASIAASPRDRHAGCAAGSR